MTGANRQPFLWAIGNAWPGWRILMAGTFAWAIIIVASALLGLWNYGWAFGDAVPVLTVFFFGAAIAFPLALWLYRVITAWLGFRTTQRFAAMFILLGMGTVGMIALIFSQEFRLYFAQHHQPFGTRIWFFQTVFTSLAAIYHFLVMGLRLLLPLGLPGLFLVSFWIARQAR